MFPVFFHYWYFRKKLPHQNSFFNQSDTTAFLSIEKMFFNFQII